MICVSVLRRQQWGTFLGGGDFEGTPTSNYANANTDFNLFGASHGVGLTYEGDQIGFHNNDNLKGAYAYRMNIGNGKLGIGVGAGIIFHKLKAEWKTPNGANVPANMFIPAENDPAIPAGEEQNTTAFDMGMGLFYKTPKLFVGISAKHLYTNEMEYNNMSSDIYDPDFFVSGGYNLYVPNTLFEIQPSFMVLSDAKVTNIILNTNVLYNNKILGGLSYRMGNALTAIVGFEVLNNGILSVSYDFELSEIGSYYGASQEFSFIYCFDIRSDNTPKQYKSIRFL
jgi:type IX secretion system PorP/SprF family membrane protein